VALFIVVGVLAYEEVASTDSCAKEFHLDVYLIVAACLFSLAFLNLAALALESAKGSIWDVRKDPRPRVKPLIYANIVLTLFEVCWVVTGSVWVVRGLLNACTKSVPVMTDVPIYATLGVVCLMWAGLFLKVLISCLGFNTADCQSGGGGGQNETLVVEPGRGGCKARLFSLCVKPSQIQFFREVANVLEDIFDDEAFVPTDLAAALLILYAQKNEEEQRLEVVSELDALPFNDCGGDGEAANALLPTTSQAEATPSDGEWDGLKAANMMSYAGAAYGYTWFLMRKTATHFIQMYPHLSCFACCCSCRQDEGLEIEADNCLQCNTAALRAMLPQLDAESIVHVSFKNKLAEVPYFVAVDHGYRQIVVSIRGTLSLEDTLTDLCAAPVIMDKQVDALKHFSVHGGMLKAAVYVHQELREKNLLDKALSYYDDYGLVLTGHSLGAGTAVILGFMLRQLYPTLRCYAFSPPGGLLNAAAMAESRKFVHSFVLGNDLVSRLSLHSLDRLKRNMKDVLLACPLPKYQILASGLTACCIQDWRQSLDEAASANNRAAADFASGDAAARQNSRDPILPISAPSSPNVAKYDATDGARRKKTSMCERLHPPGRLWHLEEEPPRAGCDVKRLRLTEKDAADFQEILVSPKMLTDHLPNNVFDALASYATTTSST